MPPNARQSRPSGRQSGTAGAPYTVQSGAAAAGTKRKRPTSKTANGSKGDDFDDQTLDTNLEVLAASRQTAVSSELLRRILHEVFEDKGTRMTQEASAGFAQYVDLFVREAIRRTSDEKSGSFLEVEALEAAAPQLLLDF